MTSRMKCWVIVKNQFNGWEGVDSEVLEVHASKTLAERRATEMNDEFPRGEPVCCDVEEHAYIEC